MNPVVLKIYLKSIARSPKVVGISSLLTLLLMMSNSVNGTPLYSISSPIGLTDSEHTRSTDGYQSSSGNQLNEAGQVVGGAQRFNGSNYAGSSVWLYNGSETSRIGLTDAAHTRSTDGTQNSYAQHLNEAGQVIGRSSLYNDATNFSSAYSAWFYNGTESKRIGFTDATHTRADGFQNTWAYQLNESGQANGTSYRYSGSEFRGHTAWLYTEGSGIARIGFTDAIHTRNDGFQASETSELNNNGQVIGYSYRFRGSESLGYTAWLSNGSTTTRLGFLDAVHTSSDGSQSSTTEHLNEAGQVTGHSGRYNGSVFNGYTAWIYDGSDTIRIGLTDAAHIRSTDGYQYANTRHLNQAGQVAGHSSHFNGNISAGQSAWLYNGSNTIRIGLTDIAHTRLTDEFQNSGVTHLNEMGQVAGYSYRYSGSDYLGQSAWLYDGVETRRLGLTGTAHTSSIGYQYSYTNQLNNAGQVIGRSQRYHGDLLAGDSAWFYDLSTDSLFDLTFSIRTSDSYAYSSADFLSEDGIVLGRYRLFDNNDNDLGYNAYWWSMEEGFFDLGTLVGGDLTANGWEALYNGLDMNSSGQIIGTGGLSDGTYMSFLLTVQDSAPVPEPTTLLLFGMGLAGLGSSRLRKKKK